MNDRWHKVETTLMENQTVEVIFETFDQAYAKVVYPPVQNYQVLLINKAIKCGRLDVVQKAVCKEWPINGAFPSLPLHTACGEGHCEFVEFLLSKGAEVNVDANSLGQEGWSSPMYFALAHDDIDLMKLLLPHFRMRKNVTPLHFACMQNAAKCATFLLDGLYYRPDHMADNFSMPLEIAVRTSAYLTELLIQHGAPLCHHWKDCKSVIHHAIHPYSNMQPVYLSHCGVHDVVRILIDSGADVNDRYQHLNLMEMFFEHIAVLFQKMTVNHHNDEGNLDYLNDFWKSLLQAAKLVAKAGLKIKTSNLMLTYQSHLGNKTGWYRDRIHMTQKKTDWFEKLLASSFKFASELLYIFIGSVSDDGSELMNIVNTTLEISNRVFSLISDNSRWNYGSTFYESLHDVLRKQFLNIPSQTVSRHSLKTIFEHLKSKEANDVIGLDALLQLVVALVPMKNLLEYQSTLPDYLVSSRMSLKFLTKLTIVNCLPYPRENAVMCLPVPETLKQYLSFILS